MKNIRFIKDSNSNRYYLVEEGKIKKVSLSPTNVSGVIGLSSVVKNDIELKATSYEFDMIVLNGDTIHINQLGKELIAKYDYVSDKVLINKLLLIQKEYLEQKSKKPNERMFQVEIQKYDWIKVQELAIDSDIILEILIDSIDPNIKRKRRE